MNHHQMLIINPKKPKEHGDILLIPVDCIRSIFSFLNTRDFHSFSATCKTLYKAPGKPFENSYNLVTNDIFYKHRLYDVLHHSGHDFFFDDIADKEYWLMYRLKSMMERKVTELYSKTHFNLMKAWFTFQGFEIL